jgi:drug/metabolite transporter (DMT)-like permease
MSDIESGNGDGRGTISGATVAAGHRPARDALQVHAHEHAQGVALRLEDALVPKRETSSVVLGAALLAALLFWASAFAAIRVGLRAFSPQSLALLRFLVASIAVGGFAIVGSLRLPSRRDLPLLLLAAVCGIPVYHVALNTAEKHVSAGTAALLINTSPVMAALLAAAALREQVRWLGWLGTFVSFAGAVVIAAGNGFHLDPHALWVLVAAAAGAVYTVVQKPLLTRMSPLAFTAWAVWIGAACLLPMLPRLVGELRAAPPASVAAGLYMGIFPTALSYAMWSIVVSRMNVSRAVSFLYLVPVFAVIIAWAWLGEIPTLLALGGGTMVIAGVVLVNASRAKPAPVAPAE